MHCSSTGAIGPPRASSSSANCAWARSRSGVVITHRLDHGQGAGSSGRCAQHPRGLPSLDRQAKATVSTLMEPPLGFDDHPNGHGAVATCLVKSSLKRPPMFHRVADQSARSGPSLDDQQVLTVGTTVSCWRLRTRLMRRLAFGEKAVRNATDPTRRRVLDHNFSVELLENARGETDEFAGRIGSHDQGDGLRDFPST